MEGWPECPGWCWEGVRRKWGEAGGTPRDRLRGSVSHSLLPMTFQPGLETLTSLLCFSHIVLLLFGGSVFLFYDVMYCHVLVLIFS